MGGLVPVRLEPGEGLFPPPFAAKELSALKTVNAEVPRFAFGGLVPGHGSGDTVSAVVPASTFILTARRMHAVQHPDRRMETPAPVASAIQIIQSVLPRSLQPREMAEKTPGAGVVEVSPMQAIGGRLPAPRVPVWTPSREVWMPRPGGYQGGGRVLGQPTKNGSPRTTASRAENRPCPLRLSLGSIYARP